VVEDFASNCKKSHKSASHNQNGRRKLTVVVVEVDELTIESLVKILLPC